ncbi:MAG: hypothetical protein AAGF31_09590 [Planctomycetota bacterium]
MSFLGKIFVVLIFIMSIIFMTLAAAVYGTHRNWEDVAKANEQKLQEARQEFDALKDQYNRVDGELRRQIAAGLQQIRKLESERERLAGRNLQIQAEVDQLTEANREATAAVTATEQNNARITEENEGLRSEIRTNQVAADEAFRKALAATEEVNDLAGQVEILGERAADLVQQNASMKFAMEENGLNPDLPADAVKPRVDGFVSAVRRRGSTKLVEVTIGSDDGLRVGHTVEVFRNAKYLGRVEILKTSPDRAVGRIDTKFQEGRIQEGDRVATRLRLG